MMQKNWTMETGSEQGWEGFDLYAGKVKLEVRKKEWVTSGSVNVYPVRFRFSRDWDGLTKTAVFYGGERVSVLLDESGVCTVPWETLAKPGVRLMAGVYGTRDGEVALPTVWADLGTVRQGASPGESAAQPPTPDLYQQLLAELASLRTALGEKAQATWDACGPARTALVSAAAAGSALRPVSQIDAAPSGASRICLTQRGKNLLNMEEMSDYRSWVTDRITGGIYAPNSSNKGFFLPVESGVTYTISYRPAAEGIVPDFMSLCYGTAEGLLFERMSVGAEGYAKTSVTFTPSDGELWYIRLGPTALESQFTEQIARVEWFQLEAGGQATDYEPYQSETFLAELPEPVSQGTYDWASGELTVLRGEASVVRRLEPRKIPAYAGVNMLSSSTGDTSVTYMLDLKRYIDQKVDGM